MIFGRNVAGGILALLAMAGIGTAEVFDAKKVIHPVVKKLGAPQFRLDQPEMFAVSTSSPKAAKHVKQGIAVFNSPWDFEAYRHFCAAAKEDPDCLMAYWGIVMSLSGNQSEFSVQRNQAVERIVSLLEVEPPVGVEIERAYALAAVRLLSEGAQGSGETYLKVSEQFPADRLSRLLGQFLTRDGYDSLGNPRVKQKVVNEELAKLIAKHPEDQSLLSFWMATLSEAPAEAVDLRKDGLPVARKLARLKPEYAPFQLAAAHVEFRCGNAKLALGYAKKASELYTAYMEKEKVAIEDCEGWIRAQLYLAHIHASKGEIKKAAPIMKQLAMVNINEERVLSRGASLLFWEARTLGARLYAGQKTSKDFDAGLKLMDLQSKEQWFEKKSMAGNYRDGLLLYLGARKALMAKDVEGAKALLHRMTRNGAEMAKQRQIARATSSYSEWFRAATNLAVMAAELQGLIAEQGVGGVKLGAMNWYQSSIEQQLPPASLLPPSLPYPMEMRLGWFYINSGKKQEAVDILEKGLKRCPNHLGTLRAYHEALSRLGRKSDAAKVKKTINLVLQ